MASASSAVLRSVPSSVIAGQLIGPASPYLPSNIITCAPHGVEHIEVSPTTGSVAPNATAMFELPLEVDLVTRLTLRFRLAAIPNVNAWYTNGIGFACIEELWCQFGTERLQTIRADELFCKMETMFIEDDKQNLREMTGFDTQANLINRARRPQTIYCPLLTLLHMSFGSDVSQPLPTRMLGEKIKLYVKFRPAYQWVSSTGGAVVINGTSITSTTLTSDVMDANSVFQPGLYVEGQHIFEDERQAHEAIACKPRRILFSEQQVVRARIPAGTSVTAVPAIDLREFNQPVSSIMIMLRWAEDLDRRVLQASRDPVTGAANTSGFNPWNIGGWYDNSGTGTVFANLPLVKSVRIDVGGSLFALKETDVDSLIKYEHMRKFKGVGSRFGVMHFTYSHDPCRPSAVLGFLDFSQTDLPRLRLTLQNPGGAATVGDASLNDTCNLASDLDVTVIGFTHNLLHSHQNALFHPFN